MMRMTRRASGPSFHDERREGDVTLGSVFHWAEDLEWERPGSKGSNGQADGATLEADDDEGEQATSTETGKPGERIACLECLANVSPKPTLWLWPEVIARGAINVAVGDPGLGKSQLSCDVAARTTLGAPWPGGRQNTPRREPASVIMLNAEDALDSVVVPRLKAAFASISEGQPEQSVTPEMEGSVLRAFCTCPITSLFIRGTTHDNRKTSRMCVGRRKFYRRSRSYRPLQHSCRHRSAKAASAQRCTEGQMADRRG